jgi:hypothetical protein
VEGILDVAMGEAMEVEAAGGGRVEEVGVAGGNVPGRGSVQGVPPFT